MPANPLMELFRRIALALRRLTLRDSKPPGTLAAVSDRATLWKIDSTEPGCVSCWWLVHQDASADLIITLTSLAQLREDLALERGLKRNTDFIRANNGQSFHAQLSAYLESQGGLNPIHISHVFIVSWRSRIPRKLKGKGDRRAYTIKPLGAFPCDLQGVTNAYASGDRYATRIAEVIARRLIRMQGSNLNSWESLVNAVDWIEWLGFYAQKTIGEHHVLQPKKPQSSGG